MAIAINRTISDAASTASFEVVNDAGGESVTVIDTANLAGAGGDDQESVMITRVFASVATTDIANAAFVTLSWGDGTEFLHLGPGVSDINIAFEHNNAGTPNMDVVVDCGTTTLFTLRLFVKKVTGFPLSMGHARNRP